MRRTFSTPGFKPTLLALLVSTGSLPVTAATTTTTQPNVTANAAADANAAANTDKTLVVTASPQQDFKPGGNQLVPAYLDGQIAHGGRLGMLGEQNAMDVPFNVISYTNKAIQDQQAKTIADVVKNDASVQNVQGYGNFAETYRIRGFELDGDDMTYGGLAGVIPRQVVDTQLIDRVEIFKGANALVNGAASTGVGGMINLEPKHAEDTPLTRVGLDYTSSSQVGGNLDVGRRFGDNNQWGVRVNLLDREGETAVDNEKKRTTAASVGLDYRGDRLRASLDLGYQKKTFHDGRIGINQSGLTFIPNVPGHSTNYSQPWVYSNIDSQFGMAKVEYDLNDVWTWYGAFGGQNSHEIGAYSSPAVSDASGDATYGRLDTNRIIQSFSGMTGFRGNFDTGPVTHQVNVGYSAQLKRDKTAWRYGAGTEVGNIYDPVYVARPENTSSSGNYYAPRVSDRTRIQGYLLSDTLGFFDNKVLFTAGARHDKVVVRDYDADTGAEESSSSFTASRWMPTYGIVYKPWEVVSLYANHTEALQPGSLAPNTATNYGKSTGIAHSKQNEVGVKLDFGRVGGSVTLFDIRKPNAITDSNGTYGLNGEQRNRGSEINLFGEPVLGFRLNASATFLDAQITKSANGTLNGKQAIGVPHTYYVLGAEYDIKPIEGLTATADLRHSGSQFVNSTNTKKLESYTTLDLGLRYKTHVDSHDMTWRVGIDNVANTRYWSSVESYGYYIYQGDPRTLKVSMSYDF